MMLALGLWIGANVALFAWLVWRRRPRKCGRFMFDCPGGGRPFYCTLPFGHDGGCVWSSRGPEPWTRVSRRRVLRLITGGR